MPAVGEVNPQADFQKHWADSRSGARAPESTTVDASAPASPRGTRTTTIVAIPDMSQTEDYAPRAPTTRPPRPETVVVDDDDDIPLPPGASPSRRPMTSPRRKQVQFIGSRMAPSRASSAGAPRASVVDSPITKERADSLVSPRSPPAEEDDADEKVGDGEVETAPPSPITGVAENIASNQIKIASILEKLSTSARQKVSAGNFDLTGTLAVMPASELDEMLSMTKTALFERLMRLKKEVRLAPATAATPARSATAPPPRATPATAAALDDLPPVATPSPKRTSPRRAGPATPKTRKRVDKERQTEIEVLEPLRYAPGPATEVSAFDTGMYAPSPTQHGFVVEPIAAVNPSPMRSPMRGGPAASPGVHSPLPPRMSPAGSRVAQELDEREAVVNDTLTDIAACMASNAAKRQLNEISDVSSGVDRERLLKTLKPKRKRGKRAADEEVVPENEKYTWDELRAIASALSLDGRGGRDVVAARIAERLGIA